MARLVIKVSMNSILQTVLAKDSETSVKATLSPMEKCVGNTGSGLTGKTEALEAGFCDKPELTALSWAARARRLYGFQPA